MAKQVAPKPTPAKVVKQVEQATPVVEEVAQEVLQVKEIVEEVEETIEEVIEQPTPIIEQQIELQSNEYQVSHIIQRTPSIYKLQLTNGDVVRVPKDQYTKGQTTIIL